MMLLGAVMLREYQKILRKASKGKIQNNIPQLSGGL
jgi:hypothetical protein